MDPMIRLRLAQAKEFAHDDLQRIGLEVDQEKQELLLRSMQESLATSAGRTLAGLAGNGLVRGIQSLRGSAEGGQQPLVLWDRQSCEGQELPSIALEFCKCHHKAIVALFPIKSNGWAAPGPGGTPGSRSDTPERNRPDTPTGRCGARSSSSRLESPGPRPWRGREDRRRAT